MYIANWSEILPHCFPCFVSALPLSSLGHCPLSTVSLYAPQPPVSVQVPVPASHQMSIQADKMEHVVLADCVCAAEQTGKLVRSDDMNCCSDITVFCMIYVWLDYYSDYMKDEVKMMHGVLGKARLECEMLLWKPYAKWSLGRDNEGWKNIVPISSTCLFLV